MPRLIALICVVLVLGALSLPGCGGPTYVAEMYAGPRRPAETVAVLRFGGADDARLVVVDGERADVPIADDARLHVEVLPGEHRMGVVSRAAPDAPLQYVRIRAEPGKVYRVVFEAGRAKAYEVDSGSDALVRDVTLAEREEPAMAPREPPPPEEPPLPPEPPPIQLEPDESAGETGSDAATGE